MCWEEKRHLIPEFKEHYDPKKTSAVNDHIIKFNNGILFDDVKVMFLIIQKITNKIVVNGKTFEPIMNLIMSVSYTHLTLPTICSV